MLVVSPLAAKAEVTTPAPPGHASGVALQVGSLLDISKTDATADSGAPTATASVIRLQGQPVLNLGGAQKGDGHTQGSLLDTGAALPAQVQVAPWAAAVDGTAGPTHHAKSSAALARARLPKVVEAGVLTSDSEATYTDQKSTGAAVSDGLNLSILDAIRVVLLHSEVRTEGKGHSYLIGLNGTEIGTDDQLGHSPLCALSASNLLALSCLTASGGAAGAVTNGAAEVAKADTGLDASHLLTPAAAFSTASSSGSGITAPAPAPIASVLPAETTREVTAAPAAAAPAQAQTTGALPRTGANTTAGLAGALAALAAGLGLRRLRPRHAAR
jgi:LPXTG cell wall anchor motif